MEKIQHKQLTVNGINMHIAEIGTGPVILFLHGFPQLWYTWRHQLTTLSSLGYRAIAPDLRGYGDSDAPPSPDSYSVFHIVGDLLSLLDNLRVDRVFLVGHDWGAVIAWHFALFRPDRIIALVNLSVAFRPRNPTTKPLETMRALLGDDYYICRFQKPGESEEEFARADTTDLLKKMLLNRDPSPPILPKGNVFEGSSQIPICPSWLSEEDISFYATKFKETGFTGGFNYYRAMDLNWVLTAAWTGAQVKVPVKFIVGDLDATYNTPGVKEYIHNGGFKRDVPNLQEVIIMEGVGHFLNEEKAEEISTHIYDFINKF